jgi:hypothetical protein
LYQEGRRRRQDEEPAPSLFHDRLPPGVPATKLLTVKLAAGEVLYIPPYWLVHAEAPVLSLSLDVLSVSKEQLILMPAFHMGLPFNASWFKKTESADEKAAEASIDGSASGAAVSTLQQERVVAAQVHKYV